MTLIFSLIQFQDQQMEHLFKTTAHLMKTVHHSQWSAGEEVHHVESDEDIENLGDFGNSEDFGSSRRRTDKSHS